MSLHNIVDSLTVRLMKLVDFSDMILTHLEDSIVKILDKNIDRKFAGAAYVEVVINGVTYTLYSDAQVRSVREVAAAALADPNANWSTNQLAVLQGYANFGA